MPTETSEDLSPAMTTLRDAGRKLARADAARDRAIAEVRDAIRAADREGGNTRTQIMKVAGVARQTVYDALRPDPSTTEAAAAAQ